MVDFEDLEPCTACGNRCPTQLEGVSVNCGVPWRTCEACYNRTGEIGEAPDDPPLQDSGQSVR